MYTLNSDSWRWQMQNRICRVGALRSYLHLSETEIEDMELTAHEFPFNVTPYYLGLCNPDDTECPIRKQIFPSINELRNDYPSTGFSYDGMHERDFQLVPNLIRRYPDRVAILVSHDCAAYCRHCTRRRYMSENTAPLDFDAILSYIQNNVDISDVLLTGGDPFLLEDEYLDRLLHGLRSIQHVEIIRIGTRVPVTLPMRITNELITILKSYHPLYVNTHFNHPTELTEKANQACGKLIDAGIPISNQTVLLRGVNDNLEVLRQLFKQLLLYRIRPYYLFQCDRTIGTRHFHVPISEGIQLINSLQGSISGLAIPKYVIDLGGAMGKIILGPNGIIEAGHDRFKLRNYAGITEEIDNY